MANEDQLSETEWAWLAGLFEGEGHIAFDGRSVVQLRIQMTDLDVMETVHRLFPAPSMRVWQPQGNRQIMYGWVISERDRAKIFLNGILPWLHSRRSERAHAALARLETNRGRHPASCPHGHQYIGDNLRITSTGGRRCRECDRRNNRRQYHKRTQKNPFICKALLGSV